MRQVIAHHSGKMDPCFTTKAQGLGCEVCEARPDQAKSR